MTPSEAKIRGDELVEHMFRIFTGIVAPTPEMRHAGVDVVAVALKWLDDTKKCAEMLDEFETLVKTQFPEPPYPADVLQSVAEMREDIRAADLRARSFLPTIH